MATRVAIYFIPFLFALCFHEYAHGWVARLRGDNTAQMMGRLTMNPLAHMDFIGTLVLPILALLFPGGLFFGWAKPVPVNERNLKNPRVDMFWIALAGPASNLLLALIATLLMFLLKHLMPTFEYFSGVMTILNIFVDINLVLAVFNAIPIHPLDGGKILARFLPANINAKLEENQHISSMILLVIVFSGQIRFLLAPVSWLKEVLMTIAMG